MEIKKAYHFKLKTNSDIEQKLTVFAGHTRFVWNKVLRLCLDRLENKQPIFWYYEASFWLTRWKQSEEYRFLKECQSQVLQQKLKDLEKGFKDGFDKKQPLKRIPKFKKKGQGDSFRFPQGFKVNNKRIYLPKIGWVGFFKSQEIVGKPKNVTVSRQADGWYMSIQVETNVEAKSNATSSIGIDLGIANFVSLSTGKQVAPVNSFKTYQKKLAKAQKALAKKQKRSNNWRKQKQKISKLHLKIKNTRRDFQHKLSTKLSKNHAVIFVEDLQIKNMSKTAKGNIENPGKNVKAKSGLNCSILDQGWNEFVRQLEYKSQWHGNQVVEVNPQYTSQKCYCCGSVSKENRKTQAVFQCLECGYQDHADINAAKNIKAVGQTVLACGEDALAISLKQELVGNCDKVQPCTSRNHLALAG